jgi:phage baseplate assembly protein W
MAYEIGKRIVKDTVEFNDYAIGIALPIQIKNVAFTQTFQTIDQIKVNIINLLSTKKGERLMQPEFGSGLQEVLFENITEGELGGKVENIIIDSFERWLPYVTVESIELDFNKSLIDTNSVNIKLLFRVGEDINLNQLTFIIEE